MGNLYLVHFVFLLEWVFHHVGLLVFCEFTGLKISKVAHRVGVHVPDHPKANNRGYILRSRYLMEKELGRFLDTNEEVHHIDENPLNDKLDNLEVMDKLDHFRLHMKEVYIRNTKLDYDKIRELRNEGYGYKKISKEINSPRNSVRSACKRMNI